MRTPNDKIKMNKKENKKIKEYAYSYVKKFMTRKYGYLGIYDFDINPRKESCFIELYLQKNYKKGGKTRIEILKNIKDKYSSYIETGYDGDNFIEINNNDIISSIEDIKSNLNKYKSQYEQAILYFSEIENIKNCIEYATLVHNLIYCTTYIYALPLAYTFLLSNQKNKIFPKEIAKIITQKMLFFKN